MASIKITRNHNLGIDAARAIARTIVAQLNDQFGFKTIWAEDTVHVKYTGVTGVLKISEDQVMINIDLNFLMSAFKGPIETAANSILDKALG
jgi:putative polyhydroxyalkanoate system protein